MARCDYCKNSIPRGTGKMYIKKDGRKLDFCSNKCEKNMLKLHRKNPEWGAK
jgi:large subunit ribosomal protein L24e